MMRFNVSEINDCIRTRRTISPEMMSDREVQKELINTLIENARWAPTHRLTQPWRFKVIRGDARADFGAWQAATYKAITPADKFKDRSYQKLLQRPTMASAIIVLVQHTDPEAKVPEIEETLAVGAAVENMLITCSAYGLASYWGSGGLTYSDELHKKFNLKENEKCVGLLYLGYPKEEWPMKTQRLDKKQITDWIE